MEVRTLRATVPTDMAQEVQLETTTMMTKSLPATSEEAQKETEKTDTKSLHFLSLRAALACVECVVVVTCACVEVAEEALITLTIAEALAIEACVA